MLTSICAPYGAQGEYDSAEARFGPDQYGYPGAQGRGGSRRSRTDVAGPDHHHPRRFRAVYEYLPGLERGFALPITRIREYAGFSAVELTDMLGSFHPPQGYTLVARHPAWLAVCEKFTSTDPVREMTVQHLAAVD